MQPKYNDIKTFKAKRAKLANELTKAKGFQVFELIKEINILDFHIELLADSDYNRIVNAIPDREPINKVD